MTVLAPIVTLALHAWASCMIQVTNTGASNLKACLLASPQALVKILDDVTNEEIKSLEIPTGVPLIYELNEDMKPVRHFHVGYYASDISHLCI